MTQPNVAAGIASSEAAMNGNFLCANITPPTSDECFSSCSGAANRRRSNSFRQPLSLGFKRERNDQQSGHEGDGGARHRNSQTAVAVNHRSQHEIDAGADETAE